MANIIQNATMIIAVIGAIAFMVSVITQVFKGVGVLAKIPTDIVVFVLSIALTLITFIAYMQYAELKTVWYMIIAAIMVGFIVSFVAMYGWEKLSELWKRFKKDVK